MARRYLSIGAPALTYAGAWAIPAASEAAAIPRTRREQQTI